MQAGCLVILKTQQFSFSGSEHTVCSAAVVMNYNDSGSHKNVPCPAPAALLLLQPACILLSRGVVANVVCASSTRPLSFQNMLLTRLVDACGVLSSWLGNLSPLCTQISFQVCLPSPLRDLISLGQNCRYLLWLVSYVTACFVPSP